MIVFQWWFATLPAWAWHHIGSTGFGGLVVMCAGAVVYAAATLAVISGFVAVLRAFLRGMRRGARGGAPAAPGATLQGARSEVAEALHARIEQMRAQD